MKGFFPPLLAAVLGVGVATGCGGAARGGGTALTPAAMAAADRGIAPYTDADVQFMAGMIPHHAQAVLIAGWAETHEASPSLRILCRRIVVAQRDEIATMQSWLRERGQTVPAADATHHRMSMNGMEHDVLMPGMLTAAELAELDRARGVAFDRLFLTAMIRHHEGAVTMVDRLFGANGGQEETVFKLASDIYADQTTEIDRMEKMLAALDSQGRP